MRMGRVAGGESVAIETARVLPEVLIGGRGSDGRGERWIGGRVCGGLVGEKTREGEVGSWQVLGSRWLGIGM